MLAIERWTRGKLIFDDMCVEGDMAIDDSVRNEELFIGLIAPIGVNLVSVCQALKKGFTSVGYSTELLRLTDKLPGTKTESDGLFERYESLIKVGNELRRDTVADIFAHIAIQEIFAKRTRDNWSVEDRRATIIRQFKRPEEIDLLKKIYGGNMLFISCHAPRSARIKYFVDKFTSESRASSRTHYEARALELIAKDEHEADDPNGQRLLDTYSKADFVLDCSSPQALSASAERFIEAFFGYPFISPTRDEYGAHMAHSASLRSADLSRQVGAAIFRDTGEVVALGCNEVPKFGGGTYWTDDLGDARDFRIGHDSNAKIKDDLVNDTLVLLKAAGWTPPSNPVQDPLSDGMIQDLLEFGRVIHAEMNAICDASRFGRSTAGATLYCTTLPCHMCSRHIVASGIHRVVYLQPYHKSLARELYPDSIAFEDSDERSSKRVVFSSFTGVTPIAFQTVFNKGKRKDKAGVAVDWIQSEAKLITEGTTEYLNLETVALSQFATQTISGPHQPRAAQTTSASSSIDPIT